MSYVIIFYHFIDLSTKIISGENIQFYKQNKFSDFYILKFDFLDVNVLSKMKA